MITRSPPLAPMPDPRSVGSKSAVTASVTSSLARISSRSTILRNWRTLPGQPWVCSTAMASSPMLRIGRPPAADSRFMK